MEVIFIHGMLRGEDWKCLFPAKTMYLLRGVCKRFHSLSSRYEIKDDASLILTKDVSRYPLPPSVTFDLSEIKDITSIVRRLRNRLRRENTLPFKIINFPDEWYPRENDYCIFECCMNGPCGSMECDIRRERCGHLTAICFNHKRVTHNMVEANPRLQAFEDAIWQLEGGDAIYTDEQFAEWEYDEALEGFRDWSHIHYL